MTRVPLTIPRASIDADGGAEDQFAQDVAYYLALTPRQLPSRYLYDALGSALFEAICRLPWYRITAAEERLLAAHGAEALRMLDPLGAIVELGSGSGGKLRILLEQHDGRGHRLDVHLVDVSPAALEAASRTIEAAADVRVTTHQARYEDGLERIGRLDPGRRTLVLFLGSNIGNFDPPAASALLRTIRSGLHDGDALLLGADLVKPARDLTLAYDDPLGVTAAFNRNLLVRINRELGGDFDLGQFAHRAVWNEREARIEMHLVSRSAQEVQVQAAGVRFTIEAGQWIWTESSYKYRPDDVVNLLEAARFKVDRQWIDREARFALTLVRAI